jgi:hypothetical protein
MLTFRDLVNEIKEFFSTEIPTHPDSSGQERGVLVEKGKYGVLPSKTPCLWIYAEPSGGVKNYNNYLIFRDAKVSVFAVVGGKKEQFEAVAESLALAEKVESLALQLKEYLDASELNKDDEFHKVEFSENPIEFDSYFSDLAASKFEFICSYATNYNLEN